MYYGSILFIEGRSRFDSGMLKGINLGLIPFSILKSQVLDMSNTIYEASVKNLKELKKHVRQLKKLANKAIRENDDVALETYTRLYALLYSTYAEVSFTKLIHSPGENAFTDSEIYQIEQKRNLEEKWNKCIDLGFSRLNQNANKGEIANKKQTLRKILNDYIIKPSQLRNKIAHGQWKVCLNNDCSGINVTITSELNKLDFVKIDRLYNIYEKFHHCILDIVISPRTHYRDYYRILTELQSYIDATASQTLNTKKDKILNSSKVKRFNERKET